MQGRGGGGEESKGIVGMMGISDQYKDPRTYCSFKIQNKARN